MKKRYIAAAVACALLAAGCGTTGNVAQNAPQQETTANVQESTPAQTTVVAQPDTDSTAQPTDADISPQTADADTPSQTAADAGVQEPAETTDTNGAQDATDTAEGDTTAPLEIIAEEEVLQNEIAERESAPTVLAEPEIFDAPDPNATNALATTVPDAEGTTPLRQTTGAVSTTTAARETPAVQQEKSAQASSTPRAKAEPQNATTRANANTQTTAQPRAQQTTTRPAQNATQTPAQSATQFPAQNTTASAQTMATAAPRTTQPAPQPTTASAQNATQIPAQSATSAAQDTTLADTASASTDTTDAVVPLEKQNAVPSRSVTIKNNQYLDVVYPGSGWVYLGETEENRDQKKQPIFSYFGRKLGTTDTTFTLRSRKPGTTLLHFYKNDALTGQYIDDYLAVTIENENAKAGVRATAPAYAEVVPPKPSRQTRQSYENIVSTGSKTESAPQTPATQSTGTTASQNTAQSAQSASTTPSATANAQGTTVLPASEDRGVKTVIQTTESAPGGDAKAIATAPAYDGTTAQTGGTATTGTTATEGESDLDLLEQAKRSYAAKQYETALDQVQRYLQDATTKIDEALFLQGQVLEAESSVKSIRSAIDSYESLTKNYPMSTLWGKANNRIIYLKRFYIEIR